MTGNVTPEPGRPTAPTAPIPTGHGLLDIVLSSLDDDQAQEVVSIDLKGKSEIADHMVIASGRSTRQVASMAQKLAEKIKHSGGRARIEGLPNADWVLLDADDVIVHLFRPEVRTFYNLERMWAFEGIGRGTSETSDAVSEDAPATDAPVPDRPVEDDTAEA